MAPLWCAGNAFIVRRGSHRNDGRQRLRAGGCGACCRNATNPFAVYRFASHSFALAKHFFCHAGVRPGVALEQQVEDDLLWIREPFLTSRADFGKIVVHGHTPTEKPEIRSNRINVDTGAYMTNVLTCAVLDAGPIRFLSVRS